jgi:hypothetical protein
MRRWLAEFVASLRSRAERGGSNPESEYVVWIASAAPRNDGQNDISVHVMPGLVPGIHVLLCRKGVDGRAKPGRDG